MKFSIFIPARYASERLPGKVLLEINNKSILQHAYECALKAEPDNIIIACDNPTVAEHAVNLGAKVIMTEPNLPNGTARIAEALKNLNFNDDDIIVNLQADEIMLPREYIHRAAQGLAKNLECAIATLAKPIKDLESLLDPNIVKVVKSLDDSALYFSRSPIPHIRNGLNIQNFNKTKYWQHIGLYAYRVSFLKKYNSLAPVEAELAESLEQLRALYHGFKIHVSEVSELPTLEINTANDLERARLMLEL
ncbi:MAG: 3-deoxy-manno-octulosonate cytidylyltransferase [Gammaproteobacteria bacterium]|nr:3-deoxy-manno-octulosonate cytidylyltransferase [Gammaproteobacteria bacterium]